MLEPVLTPKFRRSMSTSGRVQTQWYGLRYIAEAENYAMLKRFLTDCLV